MAGSALLNLTTGNSNLGAWYTSQLDGWAVSQRGEASRGQAESLFGHRRAKLPFGHRRARLGERRAEKGRRGLGRGRKKYKEGGRRIQEGIKFTFAVAIATPISHFAFALHTSHFAFRTLHPLLLLFASRLLYLASISDQLTHRRPLHSPQLPSPFCSLLNFPKNSPCCQLV